MKLLRVKIIEARTCGGLLDGFELDFRSPFGTLGDFRPFCLIGPNGAGKSQFLQVLAEMFQSLFHACVPDEERRDSNPDLRFELEYALLPRDGEQREHIQVSRREGRGPTAITVERWDEDALEWESCEREADTTRAFLPAKVIAYTSGDNETLSLPFLASRSGYADEVATQALRRHEGMPAPATRLMQIDYATHLEVLVANLLLADRDLQQRLLEEARLHELHSFRCVVQLAHRSAPSAPRGSRTGRKGIQLTRELEEALESLRACSTCSDYDARIEAYTFDFLVTSATREAFASFWSSALDLYTTLHKLAMLNDLAIPKQTRNRFKAQAAERRFATRLPEPQDEEKVFRFEAVQFRKEAGTAGLPVDYVSLSDGEHQMALLLGTMGMLSEPNVLFLLDEPESHFNPAWRVKFISRVVDLPTAAGPRAETGTGGSSEQECLLTTHAPFVASDLPREQVLIFSKSDDAILARHPEIETFGATFDTILDACFSVSPPISDQSREMIRNLRDSDDVEEIEGGQKKLGASVEKAFVADRLRTLRERSGT